jgi:hypothetical protein
MLEYADRVSIRFAEEQNRLDPGEIAVPLDVLRQIDLAGVQNVVVQFAGPPLETLLNALNRSDWCKIEETWSIHA